MTTPTKARQVGHSAVQHRQYTLLSRAFGALRLFAIELQERYASALDDGLRKSAMYNELKERCDRLEAALKELNHYVGKVAGGIKNPDVARIVEGALAQGEKR